MCPRSDLGTGEYANVPSFRSLVLGEYPNVPSFRFLVPGVGNTDPFKRSSFGLEWSNRLDMFLLITNSLLQRAKLHFTRASGPWASPSPNHLILKIVIELLYNINNKKKKWNDNTNKKWRGKTKKKKKKKKKKKNKKKKKKKKEEEEHKKEEEEEGGGGGRIRIKTIQKILKEKRKHKM